jgi:hypothetical protein
VSYICESVAPTGSRDDLNLKFKISNNGKGKKSRQDAGGTRSEKNDVATGGKD